MSNYGPDSQTARVVVTDINVNAGNINGDLVAIVSDTFTGSQFSVPMSIAGGRAPVRGDVWEITKANGWWAFSQVLAPHREQVGQGTLSEVIQTLHDMGIINWQPEDYYDPNRRPYSYDYTTIGSQNIIQPEQTASGAYIGEIRLFAKNAAPSNWLWTTGVEVSRRRYRKLFDKIGTTFGAGNGSSTFNLPYVPAPSRYPVELEGFNNSVVTPTLTTSDQTSIAVTFTPPQNFMGDSYSMMCVFTCDFQATGTTIGTSIALGKITYDGAAVSPNVVAISGDSNSAGADSKRQTNSQAVKFNIPEADLGTSHVLRLAVILSGGTGSSWRCNSTHTTLWWRLIRGQQWANVGGGDTVDPSPTAAPAIFCICAE